MNKTDKEFMVAAITIFFAALSASIAIRANINIVLSMCIGTSLGMVLGITLSGIFKGHRHEYNIEGTTRVIKEKKKAVKKKTKKKK